MSRRPHPSAPRPPLDQAGLERLALHYVGRYATTRAKLHAYLTRKLRERGGEGEIDADAIVARIVELRYVDDASFARTRAEALTRRGMGFRRVTDSLRAAGITEEDRGAAIADLSELQSAVAFARRKRIGPFAAEKADQDTRRRLYAAFARAGHSFAIARRILDSTPGDMSLVDEL